MLKMLPSIVSQRAVLSSTTIYPCPFCFIVFFFTLMYSFSICKVDYNLKKRINALEATLSLITT